MKEGTPRTPHVLTNLKSFAFVFHMFLDRKENEFLLIVNEYITQYLQNKILLINHII